MPRPSSRQKDAASLALIKMRAVFHLTQAQLAARLGVTVQTVGRWESFDPPRRATLQRLTEWAEQAHYSGAADFRAVLDAERGTPHPLWFSVDNEEESRLTMALLEVLRQPQWARLRPQLKRTLQPVLDARAAGFRKHSHAP
jgi:transcriptional regulator with XRE-family HTH domain